MPRDASRDGPTGGRTWLLQRRSTLSHQQLQKLFVLLCVPSLLVALTFLYLGYWYILIYSLLELGVLALCLRHHARHAADYDRIDIGPAIIIVEQRRARIERRFLLNPWTTWLQPPRRDRDPLQLADPESRIKLAEFLPAAQRRELARDLQDCLRTRRQ